MRYVSDMVNRSRVGWLMALSIAAVEALSLAAYGQSSPGSDTTTSSDSLLPLATQSSRRLSLIVSFQKLARKLTV
jgi:hypothetical protein